MRSHATPYYETKEEEGVCAAPRRLRLVALVYKVVYSAVETERGREALLLL